MRRMFLAVPRDFDVPEYQDVVPTPKNVTFLPGGLMVDLTADMRCATCRYFHKAADEDYSYCARLVTFGDMLLVDPDFGCKKWTARGE